jgi:hypothetical protein
VADVGWGGEQVNHRVIARDLVIGKPNHAWKDAHMDSGSRKKRFKRCPFWKIQGKRLPGSVTE